MTKHEELEIRLAEVRRKREEEESNRKPAVWYTNLRVTVADSLQMTDRYGRKLINGRAN